MGTRSRIEGLNVVVRRAKSRSSLKVTAKLTRLAASYSTEEALFLTNISFTRPGAEEYRLPIGPSPLISRKSRSAARAQTGQSHTSTGANELSNRKRREFMVATWPRSPAGPIPDSEGAALP